MRKAPALELTALNQDVNGFDFGDQQWDLVCMLYFSGFAFVRDLEKRIAAGLKPGGYVVFEGPLPTPERLLERWRPVARSRTAPNSFGIQGGAGGLVPADVWAHVAAKKTGVAVVQRDETATPDLEARRYLKVDDMSLRPVLGLPNHQALACSLHDGFRQLL